MFLKPPIYLAANSSQTSLYSFPSLQRLLLLPQHSLCQTRSPALHVLPGKRVKDVSLVGKEVNSTGYSIIRHRVSKHY